MAKELSDGRPLDGLNIEKEFVWIVGALRSLIVEIWCR